MSQFAGIVRDRVARARDRGTLGGPGSRSVGGASGRQAIGTGLGLLQKLLVSNPVCAQDEACQGVVRVLSVAAEGTDADTMTALTQLQRLLADLTAEDADVAEDEQVQQFRRQLHLALDHE